MCCMCCRLPARCRVPQPAPTHQPGPAPPFLCPLACLLQSDVSYEYFRDNFVLSTKSAYQPGQQVRRRAPLLCWLLAAVKAAIACVPTTPEPSALWAGPASCPPCPALACPTGLSPSPTHTNRPRPNPPTRQFPTGGPQVFISYGAQTNGSLFQYYGFTEQGNPNDVYSLTAAINGQPVKVGCVLCAAVGADVCWARQGCRLATTHQETGWTDCGTCFTGWMLPPAACSCW